MPTPQSAGDALKAHLFAAYNGFADKRIKNLAKSNTFIVDDRGKGDIAADGGLLSYFCVIIARVVGPATLEIALYDNVPLNESIRAWVRSDKSTLSEERQTQLTITLSLGQEARLEQLADLIAAITKPGARYQTSNYKYVCPRTAVSLRRLAEVLRDPRIRPVR